MPANFFLKSGTEDERHMAKAGKMTQTSSGSVWIVRSVPVRNDIVPEFNTRFKFGWIVRYSIVGQELKDVN
jgi:hypothetical protein